MARMTSSDMTSCGPADCPINPITGTHRPASPAEVAQPKWNVKGDAGIPTGENGDGDPMTGDNCY